MTHFILFLGVSFLVTFTPGPSVLFTISQGIRMGFWGSMPSLLGNLSASISYGIISVCSIGYFLRAHPHLLKSAAFLGSSYLIMTGIFFILQKKSRSSFLKTMEISETHSTKVKDFFDGFVVNLSNPKIMLFYLVVIPQFSTHSNHFILSLLLLTLIQNTMKAGSLLFYSSLACQLRSQFNSIDPNSIRKFSGIIIIIAGLILMLDNSRL